MIKVTFTRDPNQSGPLERTRECSGLSEQMGVECFVEAATFLFQILLFHSRLKQNAKKHTTRCKQTVWVHTCCLHEDFYQSLPICTAANQTGCYDYNDHWSLLSERKTVHNPEEQCKRSPYRDYFRQNSDHNDTLVYVRHLHKCITLQ